MSAPAAPLVARRPAPGIVALAGAAVALALALRVRNALRYPPDWGFDAPGNWQYIRAVGQSFALPAPSAGSSTADPPFFFFLGGLVWRALDALGRRDAVLVVVPLLNALAGLAIAALAAALLRRLDPERPARALLGAGLVLFLPAHAHMSVMVNEEIWTALFASLALLGLAGREPAGAARRELRRAAGVGLAAGLAVLSKLTGATAVVAAALCYAQDGLRRAAPAAATARRLAVLLAVAGAAGGWYYARNQILYGYLQPFGLAPHEQMFELPPGERGLRDYLYVPLATFTDPQLLNRDLLRSVWGSTYATLWFDGHRAFLPVEGAGVRRLGTATLLLALLPTGAFLAGLARGAGRALRAGGPDVPLVAMVAVTLGGYALFSYRNPWYAVLKGTSLLSLCLPYAYYASGELSRWARRGGSVAAGLWIALSALALCVVLGTSFDLLFEKPEVSGLPWREVAP